LSLCQRKPIMPLMDWRQAIERWSSLPPEERARIRRDRIPLNVAESMAFEGEPVALKMMEAELARFDTPCTAPQRPEQFRVRLCARPQCEGPVVKLASLEAIVSALNSAGVRYLVAGGLAVNAHGYIRHTRTWTW